jgi:LmbE family N-acetylglucosaminyl deacetylase
MRSLRVFAAAALLIALLFCRPGRAEGVKSADTEITSECGFSASSSGDSLVNLHDGRHGTAWTPDSEDGQFVEVTMPEGKPAAGIYIQWNCLPGDWSALESSGGEVWAFADLKGRERFINAYVPLSGQAMKIRIESESYDWKMTIAEIRVFAKGALPDDVQVWEPSPAKADLMVIPAHPDDELIYFGGILPYYAGQLGKQTVVVYMTSSPMIRKFEALDGLWKVGVREYPVFLPLANKYSSTVEDAETAWGGLDNTVSLLVEQMRRYKPDVVVTHDLNGEYGHGAHKLTALAAEKAVDAANNPSEYTDSAKMYGVWQVKKCYLHLYSKNRIEMDWEIPLSRFGGKTALDMAKEGYELHVSQHFCDRPIEDSGAYDNACFGLYYSSVGPDAEGGDFFENIIAATASPTEKPAETAKTESTAPEENAPAMAQQGSASPGSANALVRMLALSAAFIALAWLAIKHLTTAKHAKRLFKIRRP